MISTADYAGTITWYREKLGFDIQREWTIPTLPGVQVAYIELNGFMIEVVGTPKELQHQRQPANVFEALDDRGIVHLAFLVPDVDAVARELAARGVPIELPPTDIPDAARRILFVRDNNGNMIEFVTPMADYGRNLP
nr:VOC family protein [Croceicoccus ponticola]